MALNICTSSSPSETLERQRKGPQLSRRLAVRTAVSLLSGLHAHRVTFVCRVFIRVVIPRVSSLPYHELEWRGGYRLCKPSPLPDFFLHPNARILCLHRRFHRIKTHLQSRTLITTWAH